MLRLEARGLEIWNWIKAIHKTGCISDNHEILPMLSCACWKEHAKRRMKSRDTNLRTEAVWEYTFPDA